MRATKDGCRAGVVIIKVFVVNMSIANLPRRKKNEKYVYIYIIRYVPGMVICIPSVIFPPQDSEVQRTFVVVVLAADYYYLLH